MLDCNEMIYSIIEGDAWTSCQKFLYQVQIECKPSANKLIALNLHKYKSITQ